MDFVAQYCRIQWHRASATLVSASLLTTVTPSVLAHGGHGNEFQGGAQSTTGSIQVEAATAKRMGMKVLAVRRQRLAQGIKTTGEIETAPNRKVEVTTPIAGTVTKLFVQPGEKVKVGQAVAVISSADIANLRVGSIQKRSEAEADLKKAMSDLSLAQKNVERQRQIVSADLQQVRSQLAFFQEKYDRDQALLMEGAIPRRQALESETQLMQIKSVVAKAESRLEVLQADSQLQKAKAEVSLAKTRIRLSDSDYKARLKQLGSNANASGTVTIKAPISGTVADREITLGESGQDAGKLIMTILNDRSVIVLANIYAKDLSQIQLGQQVQVKVASLPNYTFVGRISVMGTSVAGETQVVPVKAELDNPVGSLKPGMFAELEVLTGRSSAAVLVIPKSALVETNEKKMLVFVQNGNAYQPAEVTLGKMSGEFVEVKSGLFDGDSVVVQRATQLYAQSLRGGSHAKTDKADKAGVTKTTMASVPRVNLQNLTLPWWGVLGAGGAIATTTFWAGITVAGRRGQTREIPQQIYKDERTGYEIEGNCAPSVFVPQSVQHPEERLEHSQGQS